MNKHIFICITGLIFGFIITQGIAYANGYNFIFPSSRRSIISGYSFSDPPSHQAYDYRFGMHTKVASAKEGTVVSSEWRYGDGHDTTCSGSLIDRGNYLILNHGKCCI